MPDPIGLLALSALVVVPLALVRWRSGAPARRIATECAFAVYAIAVLFVVTMPLMETPWRGWPYFWSSLNLIPGMTLLELLQRPSPTQAVRQIGGNIALFVPLGLFLPLLWRRFRSLRRMAFAGLLLSLTVELLQGALWVVALGRHSLDIDDVMLNTLGACLGFAGWVVFSRRGANVAVPAQQALQPDKPAA